MALAGYTLVLEEVGFLRLTETLAKVINTALMAVIVDGNALRRNSDSELGTAQRSSVPSAVLKLDGMDAQT